MPSLRGGNADAAIHTGLLLYARNDEPQNADKKTPSNFAANAGNLRVNFVEKAMILLARRLLLVCYELNQINKRANYGADLRH